jgi:hypothetical protein
MMHDPYSQIADLWLWTLWHKDAERHGDDDSCGWFLRSHHEDKTMLDKIDKSFQFEFSYWFNEDGTTKLSTMGIVLCMYSQASWQYFNHSRKKQRRFLNQHLFDILHFAENPTDSLEYSIAREMYYRTIEHDRSQVDPREQRIRQFASIVYSDIMRKVRPWYQHPRWHIHHWRISANWRFRALFRWFYPKQQNTQSVDQNLRDTV